MKKLLTSIAALAMCAATVLGFAACDGKEPVEQKKDLPDLQVYAPDGAPALALCNAIAKDDAKEEDSFDFHVVDASTITTFVTGASPAADVAVLPVNQAAKTLGSGATYQMLGTVTNGNLYFLTTGDMELTADEAQLKEALVGKKLGVVQLTNVPGLTLQVVLNRYHIDYAILENAEAEAATDKVNLVPFSPENVTPAGGCDFYLCPEPAASTKIKGTASAPKPFKMAGDLQALYGEEGGYPQAAIVAKKSVITERKAEIDALLGYLGGSASYLDSASVEIVLDLLDEARTDGLAPSFNANNLTKDVIARCSVGFRSAKEDKERVLTFLGELVKVSEASTAIPADDFFYMG